VHCMWVTIFKARATSMGFCTLTKQAAGRWHVVDLKYELITVLGKKGKVSLAVQILNTNSSVAFLCKKVHLGWEHSPRTEFRTS
jgi:hypothetical protein